MLSYSDFERAIQNRMVERTKNICENVKNEYLKEMENKFDDFKSTCEILKKTYYSKMEEEIQQALTDEIIQIAQDTHFYCEENIERNNMTMILKIGGF